jgi:hypothetical protein
VYTLPEMSVTGSASEAEKQKRKGRLGLGCFFSVFLLFGLGFTVVALWEIVDIIRARDWRQMECTILTSEVETHRGSKGSKTYSVAVSFEYFVEDTRYVSTRYKFGSGSTSGYDGKAEIVQRLSPGTKTVCYVNRRDPAEAVIERGITGEFFFGFIPMIFAVIGAGGLYGVFIHKGKPKPIRENVGLLAAVGSGAKAGPTTLKSATSPAVRLGCVLIFAAFWNGILSIFLVDVIVGWSKGTGDGCSTVFMIPFVLVGAALIVFSIYCFLALFNPRPTIRVSASSAALGDTVDLEWEMSGSVNRIRSFTITFEGREEATYRRGTTTSTDKSAFATFELVRLNRSKEMRRGKAKIAIPTDTMHTFRGANNKVLWRFTVSGDIPRWPDVDESFDFEVLPHRLPEGGAA